MELQELIKLIEQDREQRELSREKFANLVGVTGSAYYRQRAEDRNMGILTVRKYAKFYKAEGNIKMLRALAAYTIQLLIEQVQIEL